MKRVRLLTALFAVVAMLAVSAAPAAAANPHFIGDVNFTDQGKTLSATGSIAGLGNEDTVILITGTGVPTVTCTNPSGQTQPPGQNPAELNVAGGTEIPEESITNGRLDFGVATAEPADPAPKAAGCPNNRWDANITDIAFTSVTLSFYQGPNCRLQGGQPSNSCVLVLQQTFTP